MDRKEVGASLYKTLLGNPTGAVNSTGLLPPNLLKSQYTNSVEQRLGLVQRRIVLNCIN